MRRGALMLARAAYPAISPIVCSPSVGRPSSMSISMDGPKVESAWEKRPRIMPAVSGAGGGAGGEPAAVPTRARSPDTGGPKDAPEGDPANGPAPGPGKGPI